jgi:hypothetical protein
MTQFETELLNTLKSIEGTLKSIEQNLSYEEQERCIKDGVSHALKGDTTPKVVE